MSQAPPEQARRRMIHLAVALLSNVARASAQPLCVDDAANNAAPEILRPGANAGNNAACNYTCAGLAAHFGAAEGDSNFLCWVDGGSAGDRPWPAGDSSFTAPVGSTLLFQGHANLPTQPGQALGQLLVVSASAIVRFVTFRGLVAVPDPHVQPQASGGAIFVYNGSLVVERVLFAHNSARDYGGAIAIMEAQDVLIVGSSFYNSTAEGAAAIYIRPGRTFRQSIVSGCRGTGNDGKADGEALSFQSEAWGPGHVSSFSNQNLLPARPDVSDGWLYFSVSVAESAKHVQCTLEQLPPFLNAVGQSQQIESLAVAATVTLECVQGKSFGGAPYGGSLMGQALVGCDGGLLLVNASCASCEAFLQLYCDAARKEGAGECGACVGQHQQMMRHAQCSSASFKEFCTPPALYVA